jgi:hypothetical protein
MPPAASWRPAWTPPDITRFVVLYIQLLHRLMRANRCACWVCAVANRVGQDVKVEQGREMAAALREEAHGQAHDRIKALMLRRPERSRAQRGVPESRPYRFSTGPGLVP